MECPLIFLVGPRGSGKSTTARALAAKLGWDFIDADDVLESRSGRSVRQVFAEEGEEGFRDKEAAVLDDLCRRTRHVVATGGGVVLREANRAKLKASGFVVWLTADAPTLWRRLQQDATTAERRPALSVGGLAEVEEVLRAREPFYKECAGLRVESAGKAPEDVAEVILAALRDGRVLP